MVARYRKMYPWRPYEKTASGSKTVVFEITGVGRVGVCICYDLWFPEVIRDLVLQGRRSDHGSYLNRDPGPLAGNHPVPCRGDNQPMLM